MAGSGHSDDAIDKVLDDLVIQAEGSCQAGDGDTTSLVAVESCQEVEMAIDRPSNDDVPAPSSDSSLALALVPVVDEGAATIMCLDGPSDRVKDNKHYRVAKILQCGYADDDEKVRMFKVKWWGYNQAKHHTWEMEDELILAADKVISFCKQQGLRATHLKPLGGASGIDKEHSVNSKNWIALDQVMNKLKAFNKVPSYNICGQALGYHTVLDTFPSLRSSKISKSGQIVVIMDGCHYYALLVLPKLSLAYIADGQDMCLEGDKTLARLRRFMGVKTMIPLKFRRRLRVDHCGSACIGLCLDLARKHHNGELNDPSKLLDKSIDVPMGYLANIRKELHPHRSEPSQAFVPVGQRLKELTMTCEHCNNYSSHVRRKLQAHKMSCKRYFGKTL